MRYQKCCVPGCVNAQRLHKFPICEKRRIKWLNSVNCASLRALSLGELTKRCVCHKHFEARFLTQKSRLLMQAYPTLFTEHEICTGIPINHDTETASIDEHKYAKKEHFDHSYHRRPPQNSLPGTSESHYGRFILEPNSRSELNVTDSVEYKNGEDIADSTVVTDSADGEIHDGDTQEETDDQIFSWQRDSEINCDDFEINPEFSETIEDEDASDQNRVVIETEYDDTVEINNLEDIRLETDNQALNTREESDIHEGYKCDMCEGPIRRFRYSCVECANYDLCGACEARAAHPQHYLLRVPRPRPHGEIQLIMDTIRRFLMADPKSLRAEANFVNTLMDEMKSEVLSEAGSDPVPDEPDYPVQSDDSSDEHDDCEMVESNTTHTPATQDDDVQDVTCRDEDSLEEWEFPQEMYNTLENIDNIKVNVASDRDRERDSHARSHEQNVHIPNKRIYATNPLTSTNYNDSLMQHKPEQIIVDKIDSLSPSNTLGKVSKSIFVTCPKTISISEDVHKLLKTKDGDTMEKTINIIKHSLHSKVSIQLQRLTTEEIMSEHNHDLIK